jgi:predicted RNA-binding Zn-ribbon protein involved in translation (DUF1610 family)
MAITVEQVLKDRGLLDSLDALSLTCPHCGVAIQETITGKRRTPQGFACSECYYEQLGAEVAQYPILTGGVRRG